MGSEPWGLGAAEIVSAVAEGKLSVLQVVESHHAHREHQPVGSRDHGSAR